MTYRLSPNAVYVQAEGEIVLLHTEKGSYFNLRGAVLHVFQDLIDGAGLATMAEKIAAHFAIAEQAATDDMQNVLDKLQAAELVTFIE